MSTPSASARLSARGKPVKGSMSNHDYLSINHLGAPEGPPCNPSPWRRGVAYNGPIVMGSTFPPLVVSGGRIEGLLGGGCGGLEG